MNLKQAIIFAKDMELMTEFYRDKLGLRPVSGSETSGWIEFEAGGSRLALHAIPSDIAEGIPMADPPRAREETPIKLVFGVADVEAERARLVSQGVRMLAPKPWGACDGLDPEGNVFQIARE